MTEEVKEQKRKLPRIKVGPGNNDGYGPSGFMFSLVSSPAHERKQITSWASCRETFNHYVGKEYSRGPNESLIDKENLRLLLNVGEVRKEDIFAAKRALNLYEDLAGWNKSVISSVIHEKWEKHPMFLVTGPKQWMYSPQLMSFCTWIMRLGARFSGLNTDGGVATLEASIKHLCQNGAKNTNDAGYGEIFWNKGHVLVKNYEAIFKEDPRDAWKHYAVSGFSYESGIVCFSRKDSSPVLYSKAAGEAKDRFVALCREEKQSNF